MDISGINQNESTKPTLTKQQIIRRWTEKLDDNNRRIKVLRVGETLTSIFNASDTKKLPTGVIANEMAAKIIANAKQNDFRKVRLLDSYPKHVSY